MAKAPKTETVVASAPVIVSTSVKNVQVFGAGDSALRYRVTFDTMFTAMKKNYETEEYEEAQVDYIDFVPRVLIAQVINLVPGVDVMYTKKKEQGLKNDNGTGFGAAELQVILRGSKLKIERTKFDVGSEYTTADGKVEVHENAGYNTNITEIKVSDRIQGKLDDIIDSVFDF